MVAVRCIAAGNFVARWVRTSSHAVVVLATSSRYFPIEQFVFLSFEDMEGDADGVQSNIDAVRKPVSLLSPTQGHPRSELCIALYLDADH